MAIPPITIVAVGKLKGVNTYLQKGIDEYTKRLSAYTNIKLIEVPEETISATTTRDQILQAEGARLLKAIPLTEEVFKVAMSEHGKPTDSYSFSHVLFGPARGESSQNQPFRGTTNMHQTPMIVMVGGPLGIAEEVIQASDWTCSLSPLTFPHPMVRLVLLEQLYRAVRIQRNEPYHK